MIIKLIDGFYIETDEMNFMLKEKYMGKDLKGKPKEQHKTIGYYNSVLHALNGLTNYESLTSDSKLEVEEYIEKQKELNDTLIHAFKNIPKEYRK